MAGVELILHAGDVGRPAILEALRGIAPVHAVTGNVDDPLLGLPERVTLNVEGLRLLVTHGHDLGSPTPAGLAQRYRADVIIYGHTHKPSIERIASTLVVNPGAAGPGRFNLKPSVGLLRIERGVATAEIVEL